MTGSNRSRVRCRGRALVLAIGCSLWAGTVEAAPPVRIVVVPGGEDEATRTRLLAELGSSGFDTQVAGGVAADPAGLATAATRAGAVAAISVVVADAVVEVWVVDRLTRKILRRRVPEGADPGLVAVHAIELLRASLLELESPARREAVPRAVPPVVRRLVRPRDPRFAVVVAPGVAWSPGGVPPAPQVELELRLSPHRWLGIGVHGIAPVSGAVVRGPEGTARLFLGEVGVVFRAFLRAADRVVRPDLGGVAGAGFLGMDGSPRTGYQGRHVTAPSLFLAGRAGLAVALGSRVRLRLDFTAGVLVPRAAVEFADRRRAVFGRPLVLGALGVEFLLP